VSERTLHCTVADPAGFILYDVAAYYRKSCFHPHDSQGEHLCELSLTARPMREPAVPSTVCDIVTIPTTVLVAIQTKLRDLLGQSATTSNRDHAESPVSVVP
jgi:hypothetical protein